MFMLRLFGKLLAVVGIIVLSGLRLGVKVLENVGARVAGVILVFLGILALMAVVSTNWFALTVFGVLAVGVVAILFGAATFEAIMEIGCDALKACLK